MYLNYAFNNCYWPLATEKDTLEDELLEVTFQPKLCTFEDDINNKMGIVETRKRRKTYWH